MAKNFEINLRPRNWSNTSSHSQGFPGSWPTTSGTTEAEATEACRNRLNSDTTWSTCPSEFLTVPLANAVETCKTQIQVSAICIVFSAAVIHLVFCDTVFLCSVFCSSELDVFLRRGRTT